MRILVVSNLYSPDHAGGAAIYSDLCTELAARGHDVTVRTSFPYFPEWRDKSGRNGLRRSTETIAGVTVVRHGMVIPTRPTSLKQRMFYEGSLFLSLLRGIVRSNGADVVLAFSTMVSPVAFAVTMSKVHRRPVLLNVQDLSSGGAAAANMVSGRAGRLLGALERRLFRSADRLSSISPEMVTFLDEMVDHEVPVSYVPNWLNQSMADHIAALPDKSGRAPSRPLRLLYAGNIGNKQGLLEFCQYLHDSEIDVQLRIHGSGPGAEALQQWWSAHHDPRISFGPLLAEPDFVQALHDTDLFVITERANSGASYMPSKLIPSIAVGTPILAVCDGASPLGQEMARSHLGPHLEWTDLAHLRDLLASISAGHRLVEWQESCLARAKEFERTGVIDEIEGQLHSLAESRPRRH